MYSLRHTKLSLRFRFWFSERFICFTMINFNFFFFWKTFSGSYSSLKVTFSHCTDHIVWMVFSRGHFSPFSTIHRRYLIETNQFFFFVAFIPPQVWCQIWRPLPRSNDLTLYSWLSNVCEKNSDWQFVGRFYPSPSQSLIYLKPYIFVKFTWVICIALLFRVLIDSFLPIC